MKKRPSYDEAFAILEKLYLKYQGRSVKDDIDGQRAWIPWIKGLVVGTSPENGKEFVLNMIRISGEYHNISVRRLNNLYTELLKRDAYQQEIDMYVNILKCYEPHEDAVNIVSSFIMNSEEYKAIYPPENTYKLNTPLEAAINPKTLTLGEKFETIITSFNAEVKSGLFSQVLISEEFPNRKVWLPDYYSEEEDEGTYDDDADTGRVKGNWVVERSVLHTWKSTVPKEFPPGKYELHIHAFNDPYDIPHAGRVSVSSFTINGIDINRPG